MSWLSNLAKQGEAFLDNLDQQAGAAIDNVEKQVVQKVREKRDGNLSSPGMGMDRGIPRPPGISRSEWSPHHSRSNSRDKRIERGTESPSLRDSPILNRSISMSSRLSSQDRREIDDVSDGLIIRQYQSKSSTPPSGRTSPRDTSESEFELVSGPGSIIGTSEKTAPNDSIDLQLENRLLRQEMNSLNLEISRLIDTQRKSDRELELANQELQRRRKRNMSESEQHSHQMESVLKEREQSMREMDAQTSKFESEKTSLSEALSKAQILLQQEKTRAQDLAQQCRTYKTSVDSLQHDLEDYKSKSTRILQSKEKLIESLKKPKEDQGVEEDSKSHARDVEMEELRNENEHLEDENKHLKTQIQNLRFDLVQAESQAAEDYELIENRVLDLELSSKEEKNLKDQLGSELSRVRSELRQVQKEFDKERDELKTKILDKDREISKLRGQVINRATDSELEKRLRALTETLIEKQQSIEGLSADKTTLGLELERLKADKSRQYAQAYNAPTGLRKRGTFDYDEEALVTDKTDDAVGKIKRAVGALDKLSIRLGVLLKRYPTVRLLVIVYMIVLHVWTSVVLVTYEPEMHGSNFPVHQEPHHAAKQFQSGPLPDEAD